MSPASTQLKTKARVLIADDSITIQKLVNVTLAGLNFEVITSMDGQDALIKIRRMKPSLVLADADLQELNGLQLLDQIRSDSELLRTRFVLMRSAPSHPLSKASGIDAVLDKPFDSKQLLSLVQGLIAEEESTVVRAELLKSKNENKGSIGEEETLTQKAGLFSSFRKAESSLNLDEKLAQIASEVIQNPTAIEPESSVESLNSDAVPSERLEEIAREEIQRWLSQHLRPMAEDLLKEELARLAEDSEN